MTIYVLMQNDFPIGVYRTIKGVKSRIKYERFSNKKWKFKKMPNHLRWTASSEVNRPIHYWATWFDLGKN